LDFHGQPLFALLEPEPRTDDLDQRVAHVNVPAAWQAGRDLEVGPTTRQLELEEMRLVAGRHHSRARLERDGRAFGEGQRRAVRIIATASGNASAAEEQTTFVGSGARAPEVERYQQQHGGGGHNYNSRAPR